jgi:hypothetical protein
MQIRVENMPQIPNGEAEVQIDFKAELEEFKAQSEGRGRFKKLENGKITDLNFTGKAVLKNNKWGDEQYVFDLSEKNDKGEALVLGVKKKNPFSQKLIEQFANGNFKLKVLRTGTTQSDTRYTIVS